MTPAFSPSAAAFAGFRLMRERPRALAVWTALQTGLIACLIAVNLVLLAPSVQQLRQLIALMQVDLQAAFTEALRIGLALLAVDALILLFFFGVQNAAIYRAYLRPDEQRAGYLRLGRTELHVAIVPVIYSLLWLAYLFVIQSASRLGGEGSGGRLLQLLLVVAPAALLIYLLVRLSLAIPLTFASGRIRILQSWRLTRGQFWPLFGAYFLAFVYVFIAGIVGLALFAILAWIIERMLGGAGAPSLIAQALTALISLPFNGLLLAASFAIWRGPSATAYLALSGARDDPGA